MKTKQQIYSWFETYFDGCYDIEPISKKDTYQLGITKIKYHEDTNILDIHTRRPGLIIGKGGKDINRLETYLDCNINLFEVKNLWEE